VSAHSQIAQVLPFVPLLQEALDVFPRWISLAQALLAALAFLGLARASVQRVVLLATQRRGEGTLAVDLDGDGLAVVGADDGDPATIAEVRLQSHAKGSATSKIALMNTAQ
jgi:hypothetical protein